MCRIVILLLICFGLITDSQQNVIIPNGRIVHGSAAAVGQFPFYARIKSITASSERLCGGSLITTEWVYTAAQCVKGYDSFEIGLGSNTLNNPVVVRTSTSARAHVIPLYNPETMYLDVALIQIDPLTLNNVIKTIDLPWWIYGYEDFFVNLNAQTMGFGQLADGTYPNQLQYVNMVTIPTTECSAIYGLDKIGSDKVCARGVDVKQNICYGDFGGPLIFTNGTTTFQIGIASFVSVMPCASGYPSAYTRVESNLKFVEYITGWSGY